MTGTERKVFEIILTKEKVGIFEIAQKMGISTDYANLICQGLRRHNSIDIAGNYCSICRPKEELVKKQEEIPPKISKKREKQETTSLSNLKTINKKTLKILRKAGYKTIEDIAQTPFSIFMQATGINLSQASKIFNETRGLGQV